LNALGDRWSTSLSVNFLLMILVAVGLAAELTGCAPKRVVTPAGSPPPDTPAAQPATPATPLSSSLTSSTPADPFPLPRLRPRSGARPPAPGEESAGLTAAQLAAAQIGKPYAYGAAGPDRFDCSGLVYWVYGRLGVRLPRVARAQARYGNSVPLAEAHPGDLLCFALRGREIDHVGLYLGRHRFVHAPRRGRPVAVDSVTQSYWRRRLRDVRRVVFPQDSGAPREN
jgi:cell wall-associated NlpC family hydrolase